MVFRDLHARNAAHLNRIRAPVPQGISIPGGPGGTKPPPDPTEDPDPPAGPTTTRTTTTTPKPPVDNHTSTSTSSSRSTPTVPSTSRSSSVSRSTSSDPPPSQSTPGLPSTSDPGLPSYTPPTGDTPTYNYPTPSGSPTPSETSTDSSSSSGGSTVKYIGYAAGAVLGFGILVALIMFIMRRINKRRENEALGDVFDRHSFVRDSVAIPDHANDESSHPSERGRPRPPTMIDRHLRATNNNTPFNDYSGFGGAPAPPLPSHNDGGYYGNNGYNNGGYDQYPANGNGYGNGYDNNQYDQYGQYSQYDQYSQPQQGYAGYHDSPAQSPMGEHFDHAGNPQYLNHQVGHGHDYPAMPPAVAGSPTNESGRSLTRQASSKVPAVDYPNVAELGRGTSVTPYQAAQYAEISKRLDDPNGQPSNSGQAYARLDRQPPHHRAPVSDDDAYGGI